MSKKLKIMFAFMAVIILCLGCALVSVAVTIGQPYGTTESSAEVYEAPALNEAPAEPEVAEPAAPAESAHPLGWSAADEAESVAYAERSMVHLEQWLTLLDEAMDYNDQMVADPTAIFDISWVTGYYFVLDDWITHADKCLAWDIPVAPVSEVDYLMKQSCIQTKASARSLQRGLNGLPDDIDGLIYELGVATSELDLANQYMDDANDRLQEILLIVG